MARRRFDDEGSGALSESFLSVPESEASQQQSSMPQPIKPPVPRIRRSLFPSALAPDEATAAGASPSPPAAEPSVAPPAMGASAHASIVAPSPSRGSRLPPPALPPKIAPLPPMRAPMHSDSGVTLRRERPAPDLEPTTAAISIEPVRPQLDARALDLDEGNSVTKMHPLDAEQIERSRRGDDPRRPGPPSYALEEPTALFDRAAADSRVGTASRPTDSSKEEESTRLLDRSQLIDSRAVPPDSGDFEASTRVVREERPRSEAKSVPPPLLSPLARAAAEPPRYEPHAVISSLQEYGGSTGSLSQAAVSQEAISLQSGDLMPYDEPSSPWARVDSSGGKSMRFDFGDDMPDSESRSELEFLPRSMELDPSRPFAADALASPRMPLDLSLDSSDVISAPPSLEPAPPPSVRPPPVAAPIAWDRRERKAPLLGRAGVAPRASGAPGGITPAPGRLAGRPRNLAGPPRPQKVTPPPPAPESEPLPSAPPAPEPHFVEPAPSHGHAQPPVYAAPTPESESYVPAPRQPLEGYSSGARPAYAAYGAPRGSEPVHEAAPAYEPPPAAFEPAEAPESRLPDYDDPPPPSELPDPRGYASPVEPAPSHDPYAPAPEWGAGFLQGKRPDSSYREFPRPAASSPAGHGASSEASFVGGKFIDESVRSSSPGALAHKNAAYDSSTGPRRGLVSAAAERSFSSSGSDPYFPQPPVSTSSDATPESEEYSQSYDSGISQQFQSLPILPTASELLAKAAERGQPAHLGAPPPAPRAPSGAVAAATAPRSRVLWLAYSLLLGGVAMVAFVHFTFGDDPQPKRATTSASTAPAVPSAPAVAPVAPLGAPYAPPGVVGVQPGAVGVAPPGYGAAYPPPPGLVPGQPYGAYPGAQPGYPMYATPTDVAPPASEEPAPKPKAKAPPRAAAPKNPAPAKPPAARDDEKPPATSDSKPAKDSSGKASSDLFDNAL